MRDGNICNYLSVGKERKKERNERRKWKTSSFESRRAKEGHGTDWRTRLYVEAIGKGMCVSRLVIDNRNYTELLSVGGLWSGFTFGRDSITIFLP